PGGFSRVADVVVRRQTLIRAEGLPLDRPQGLGNHVGAGHIPARRETRLVEHKRGTGVRDELIALPHDEVTGTAPDVAAVIGVGRRPENALALFIKGVPRPPCERDALAECGALRGWVDVLPSAAVRDLTITADDVEPPRFAKVRVRSPVVRGP